MLDPLSALSFEMQAAPGVFALLLGSGISRSAKVPTGWEITLELVQRVAALRGEACGEDPAAWFENTFGQQPDYSGLLDQLTTTPPLRQRLLKPFLEPSDEERDRGEKLPTAAHRAIATLMQRGYIRVVVTTNFDRLLEQALADLGVHPSVISSADQAIGAVPLIHAGPTIVKLHGDYLDTRIRNTLKELSVYESNLSQLLDRILDEFGLVVCGWSGEWDVALRAAIDRAPSRRYPTYWATRGEPGSAAAGVIDRRAARRIEIKSADQLFVELAEKVTALEGLSKPHPLSAELAVAMLKEFVPEPRHRIRLHDLIQDETNHLMSLLEGDGFNMNTASNEIFKDQVRRYEAAMSLMLPMAYAGGLWSTLEQTQGWVDAIAKLALRKSTGGMSALVDLRVYPAATLLYAFGLGAVVGRQTQQLGLFARDQFEFGYGHNKLTLADRLNASQLLSNGQGTFNVLDGYEHQQWPLSNHLADLLRPVAKRELAGEAFDSAFAELEMTFSFGYAERESEDGDHFWAPPGRYVYQGGLMNAILERWRRDYAETGNKCALSTMAGLKKAPRFDEVVAFAHRAKRFR